MSYFKYDICHYLVNFRNWGPKKWKIPLTTGKKVVKLCRSKSAENSGAKEVVSKSKRQVSLRQTRYAGTSENDVRS